MDFEYLLSSYKNVKNVLFSFSGEINEINED